MKKSKKKIKEALEKQLQLLSERSKDCIEDSGLEKLTGAMISLAELLLASF